jgi:hypothetical protein
MTEFRSDHELPSVLDNDPAVLGKLAELIGSVIDFDIPAFGIDHDPSRNLDHWMTHLMHREIILEAASLVSPQIKYDCLFEDVLETDFGSRTLNHTDLLDFLTPETDQKMILRLHTADAKNGANVTTANAGVSFGGDAGDVDLFDEEGHPGLLGQIIHRYDPDTLILINDEVFDQIPRGSYEPIYSEAEIYHYTQNPLSSIFFRSSTSMGPSTVHGFEAHIQQYPRKTLHSDLEVLGQFKGI